MSRSKPPRRGSRPPADDFISKHGQRIVVIIFCILAGDALPVIIQHGLDPREKFYTIVLVTLPYTAAVALFLFYLVKSGDENSFAMSAVLGVFLMIGLGLGAALNWGISESEVEMVMHQIWVKNHPPGQPAVPGILGMRNAVGVIIVFYFNKYGLALFVGATLAAVVLAWNMARLTEKR